MAHNLIELPLYFLVFISVTSAQPIGECFKVIEVEIT